MELWVSHEATLLLSYCLYILTARLCMHEYSRGGQSTHEWTTYSVTLHDEIKCETAQILKCTYRAGCARSSRERTKECKSAVEWYDGEIIANQTAIFQIENNNVFIIVIIWNSINTWVYLIEWLLYVFGIVSASSIAAFVHCRLVRFAFKFMSSCPLQYIFFFNSCSSDRLQKSVHIFCLNSNRYLTKSALSPVTSCVGILSFGRHTPRRRPNQRTTILRGCTLNTVWCQRTLSEWQSELDGICGEMDNIQMVSLPFFPHFFLFFSREVNGDAPPPLTP